MSNSEMDLRWSISRINEWVSSKPWLIGCNYMPSSAMNQVEMWHAAPLDEETISRELSLAASLGFNTLRVFLHDLIWRKDRDEFLKRIDRFLSISQAHSLSVMFVFFDGVWDPFPTLEPREPRKFVHNSGWLQSPGAEILADPSRHDELEEYVTSVLAAFRNDNRVLMWDLFNEPDNLNPTSYLSQEPHNKSELSMMLLRKVFRWARRVDPAQPLTAGLWYGDWSDPETMKAMDHFMVTNSDVISFHNYDGPAEMESRIKCLLQFDRPLVCTEYMARTFGSTFQAILPIFKKYNVGGYNWGFVNGRSQTNCPWDSWLTSYDAEPPLWFHDIFRNDGTPYHEDEVNFIRAITGGAGSATRWPVGGERLSNS